MQAEKKNVSVSLKEAKIEKKYKIVEIKNKQLLLKLLEMGCILGMSIFKISAAPFGGPVLLKIFPGEQLLAVRQEESQEIMVCEI